MRDLSAFFAVPMKNNTMARFEVGEMDFERRISF
jgi:hypothetical protein